jgi:AmmeMemoRadiSam system protein A
MSMKLSRKDKCLLTSLAMDRLRECLVHGWKADQGPDPIPESLASPGGVFVSLYAEDKLRGCIGTFSSQQPLYLGVQQMAEAAATTDSRFPPLEKAELEGIRIEISVLTPRVRISGPGEIEIGRHGIYMEKGFRKGTLLPQVAVNQGWDTEQFLGNCAMHKAGIGYDGWKDADLYTYEALIFNSVDFPPER